jgi:predicted ribosome quality control (RQC) complex YloA/Tae2 family protein
MREESWSDREIKRKREYKPPKQSVIENLSDAISDKYIISSLMKLPLGKEYAIEILGQCKIDEKTPGGELNKKQIEAIEQNIESMLASMKPYLFVEQKKPIGFGLFPFSEYSDTEQTDSLSSAIDNYYWENKEITIPKMDKLERRLAEQEERLIDLEKQEKQHKEMGDLIYSNYENLDKLIELGKTHPLDELEKKLKTKINKKEKSLEIDL